MRFLEGLRDEHAIILDVLDELETAAYDEPYLARVVASMRRFIEQNHHGKEERALFPRMRENPFLQGMAEILHEEHEQGEAFIGDIERALEHHSESEVFEAIGAYSRFLRDHIKRENEMIFDAVESALGDADAEKLVDEFGQIERESLGNEGYSDFASLRMRAPAGRRR